MKTKQPTPRKQIRKVSEKLARQREADGVKMYGRTVVPKKAKRLKDAGIHLYGSSIVPKKNAKKKPVGRGPMAQRRTKIAKSNPERQKKVAKRGAAKHRAYMASETRKAVDVRAGGRCEFAVFPFDNIPVNAAYDYDERVRRWRCVELNDLQHHHKTYARYGGKELPEDMLVVCKPHHEYLESLKPCGNRRSRSRHVA